METLDELVERKREILVELGGLGDMRRGSVTEQYYDSRRARGAPVKQGPYYLYTYKEKGKTVSRRLAGAEEAERYREEIERFRCFERLSWELVAISQRICEARRVEGEEAVGKKKLLRPSSKKWGGRSKD